jgi:hypothetical protein
MSVAKFLAYTVLHSTHTGENEVALRCPLFLIHVPDKYLFMKFFKFVVMS